MTLSRSYKSQYDTCLTNYSEIGYVSLVVPPIVRVNGLPGAQYGEIVYFESGEMGFILSLSEEFCDVLLFSRDPVSIGTAVTRSGNNLHIRVGPEYVGKSVNALGEGLDEPVINTPSTQLLPIERPAAGIEGRIKITRPFETGVAVVDLMVPLGCGQRELVLGDRQTGKTEFLLQTLLTQAAKGTLCIYANIGKKHGDIRHIWKFVQNKNLTNNVIMVSSSSTDALGMIYITPYAAMTMAEYFVQNGRDVLLILDDLSTHAKFYREISLLARRFPGRNSYPGDIFYSHSRLLERGGNFMTNYGEHSLTCLTVAETIQSDISGYIQTNLMSITDGHIYFDQELFAQGRRPAINYFLSVTRVGRQTQNKIRSGINRELISFLSLYEKTQRYIHFGAEINEGIKATLNTGTKVLTLFDQAMGTILDQNLQIAVFCLIWTGMVKLESSSKIKYLLYHGQDLYQSDRAFRSLIDSAIDESSDFNSLLGKLSSKSKDILKYFYMDNIK